VRSELTIDRKSSIDSEALVTLSNTSGQILKQATWLTDKLIWSVEDYSKGVYVISIFEKGKIVHRKLIIE
jgi:hypothetical protein